MQTEYPAPQALIDLVQKKYDLKVIDSHYILVDAKFQQYSMMFNVQFNEQMKQTFAKLYPKQNEANGVVWDICPKTDSIRFMSDIGNNILLLWDTLLQSEAKDICSPDYYVKLNKQPRTFHTVYNESEDKE